MKQRKYMWVKKQLSYDWMGTLKYWRTVTYIFSVYIFFTYINLLSKGAGCPGVLRGCPYMYLSLANRASPANLLKENQAWTGNCAILCHNNNLLSQNMIRYNVALVLVAQLPVQACRMGKYAKHTKIIYMPMHGVRYRCKINLFTILRQIIYI